MGLVGVVTMLVGTVPASAEVKVDGSDDKHLVVDARNATVQEILSKISEGRNFTVERSDVASEDRRISTRFEGSVSHILDRVLEQENNVVLRDEGQSPVVARIVLYGPQRDKALQPETPPAAMPPEHRANLVKVEATRVASATPSPASNKSDAKRHLRQTPHKQLLHADAGANARKTK